MLNLRKRSSQGFCNKPVFRNLFVGFNYFFGGGLSTCLGPKKSKIYWSSGAWDHKAPLNTPLFWILRFEMHVFQILKKQNVRIGLHIHLNMNYVDRNDYKLDYSNNEDCTQTLSPLILHLITWSVLTTTFTFDRYLLFCHYIWPLANGQVPCWLIQLVLNWGYRPTGMRILSYRYVQNKHLWTKNNTKV